MAIKRKWRSKKAHVSVYERAVLMTVNSFSVIKNENSTEKPFSIRKRLHINRHRKAKFISNARARTCALFYSNICAFSSSIEWLQICNFFFALPQSVFFRSHPKSSSRLFLTMSETVDFMEFCTSSHLLLRLWERRTQLTTICLICSFYEWLMSRYQCVNTAIYSTTKPNGLSNHGKTTKLQRPIFNENIRNLHSFLLEKLIFIEKHPN